MQRRLLPSLFLFAAVMVVSSPATAGDGVVESQVASTPAGVVSIPQQLTYQLDLAKDTVMGSTWHTMLGPVGLSTYRGTLGTEVTLDEGVVVNVTPIASKGSVVGALPVVGVGLHECTAHLRIDF